MNAALEMPTTRRLEGPTRGMPRALVVLTLVLLAARVASGLHERRHPLTRSDLIHWHDLEMADVASRETGRPILYDFSAEWCPPCTKMRREVFASPDEAAFVNASFVPVLVVDRLNEDGKSTPAVDELKERFAVNSFPTIVIVPVSGGKPIIIRGYAGRTALLAHLEVAARKTSAPR